VSNIKQSVVWWCFVPRLSPETFIRAAAEIGYAGIDQAPREYWPLIRELGMGVSSINGFLPLEVGLNQPDLHDRLEQQVLANLALAKEWGIPNLIVFSGNRNGLDEVTGADNTIMGLRRLAPAAEAAGVTLGLELLNSKVDHPDYQCDHTAWGLEVVKAVGSPRVKLLYDIYHMQIMEGDLIRTIQMAADYISHIHTAGNPGRNDLDDTQEIHYPGVLQAIAATGYEGYVAHEYLPKGEPVAAMRKTFQDCAPFLK
jgi:hydroxypyruvate isomerase